MCRNERSSLIPVAYFNFVKAYMLDSSIRIVAGYGQPVAFSYETPRGDLDANKKRMQGIFEDETSNRRCSSKTGNNLVNIFAASLATTMSERIFESDGIGI